jgi:hypothetical protein
MSKAKPTKLTLFVLILCFSLGQAPSYNKLASPGGDLITIQQ